MLDQMSGGRFLYGVGRGISPIEVGFYGIDFATGTEQFREAYEVIRIGLTEDELTYHGKFYDFDHVPIVMKPQQKPFPELWYGTSRPDSIPWAAKEGAHIVTMRDTAARQADKGIIPATTFFETTLAEAEAGADETDAAFCTINRALALSERTGLRWYDAESHRIRGEILLKRDPGNASPAEDAFLKAIAVACEQGARSFRLRAALALAKLYRATGRDADAHAILSPALEGFASTREMPEIGEAQALLAG